MTMAKFSNTDRDFISNTLFLIGPKLFMVEPDSLDIWDP